VLNGWPVPDLRAKDSDAQRWSAAQLAALLATGRSDTTGVTGEMALAVDHSLQYLPKGDLDAVVAYLKAIRQDRPVNGLTALRASAAATTQTLDGASPSWSWARACTWTTAAPATSPAARAPRRCFRSWTATPWSPPRTPAA
jgi:hypothetical protein